MLIQPAYNPLCSFEKNILKLKATPRTLIKSTALYAPISCMLLQITTGIAKSFLGILTPSRTQCSLYCGQV